MMLNRDGERHDLEAHGRTPFGLYGRRTFLRPHSRAFGQRVWLLPDLGLRVISWIPRPEATGLEDYYIDIARIAVTGDRFTMIDYYLDILVWSGRRVEVLDQDEFVQAIAAGHLDAGEAEWALTVSHQTLEGLAGHDYRLESWLRQDHGIDLTWS